MDSFFIRTSGCNLRCWFCDTPYASWNPSGSRQSVDELVALATSSGSRHVVLTGGEPLIVAAAATLIDKLRQSGLHVTVETAGTVDVDSTIDLLSLSPKLSASTPDAAEHPTWAARHESRRIPIDVMRRLIDRAIEHQVKFVVDSIEETDEILGVIDDLRVDAGAVWIMPQGVTVDALDDAATWLRPWTDQRGFRYCDRMHIRWYGNRRGT